MGLNWVVEVAKVYGFAVNREIVTDGYSSKPEPWEFTRTETIDFRIMVRFRFKIFQTKTVPGRRFQIGTAKNRRKTIKPSQNRKNSSETGGLEPEP